MSSNYIYYWELKSATGQTKVNVCGSVYSSKDTVLERAVAFGKTFDPIGKAYTIDGKKSLVYASASIYVYVLKL